MRIWIKNTHVILFTIFTYGCVHSSQNDYAIIKTRDTSHIDIKAFDKKSNLLIEQSLNSDSLNDGYYYVWQNEQLICSGQFKDGKRDGTWFFMNLNHDTIRIENWFSDKQFGQQISYFSYSNHSQVIKKYIFWGMNAKLFEMNFDSTGNVKNMKGFPVYCAFNSENIKVGDTFNLICSWGVPNGFNYVFSISETDAKNKKKGIIKSENSDTSDSKKIWKFNGNRSLIEKKYSSKGQYRWMVKLHIINPRTNNSVVNDSTEINLNVQ
jgi:hypothetical protein